MLCTLTSMTSSNFVGTNNSTLKEEGCMLHKSFSSKDLCQRPEIRRSYSENYLYCYKSHILASSTKPKLKGSRSMGFFHIPFSGTLQSFLSDEESNREKDMEHNWVDAGNEEEMDVENRRVSWVEKLLEIRDYWKEKQTNDEGNVCEENEKDCKADRGCEVDYEDNEVGKNITAETFSAQLKHVSWSDTKIFSHLAFLSNMAYKVLDLKTMDLRRHCNLDLVTSSLEKKAEVAAFRVKIEQGSSSILTATSTVIDPPLRGKEDIERKHSTRSSAAFEIALAAASYNQAHAKGLISLGSDPGGTGDVLSGLRDENQEMNEETSFQNIQKSEMAACVAASTMTAVVAAGEKQILEAAKDLQSLHSSPCEWFICDDSTVQTRYFIIQGSESMASWQANLLFEPTKFEGTDVSVHRGIYEAAKGIYEQFLPEIMQHLDNFGEKAKFQFTGHSLGGSIALLINLMLLTRNTVKPSALLPVVTFGSPFVFCDGRKVLDNLGLDESHVYSMMMPRDIVPRAFSCTYPNYAAQILRRLNGTFRSHSCLEKDKLLYSPMGKIFILQPDEKSSPPHPLLPPGAALYVLENVKSTPTMTALRAFLNSPHPLETLSDPKAYGSNGTILRDHKSCNYLKALNDVIRQSTILVVRKAREPRNYQLWPLLTSKSPHAWSQKTSFEDRVVMKEITTGA